MTKEANPERVALLVAALRSGDYEQVQGRLAVTVATKDGVEQWKYCCLGVACEVAIANGVEVPVAMLQNPGAPFVLRSYDNGIVSLPRQVGDWFGFSSDDPMIDVNVDSDPSFPLRNVSATHANDSIGLSFAQIADAFERTYITKENNEENSTPA